MKLHIGKEEKMKARRNRKRNTRALISLCWCSTSVIGRNDSFPLRFHLLKCLLFSCSANNKSMHMHEYATFIRWGLVPVSNPPSENREEGWALLEIGWLVVLSAGKCPLLTCMIEPSVEDVCSISIERDATWRVRVTSMVWLQTWELDGVKQVLPRWKAPG